MDMETNVFRNRLEDGPCSWWKRNRDSSTYDIPVAHRMGAGPRDRQRQRMYDWERDLWKAVSPEPEALDQLRGFLLWVWSLEARRYYRSAVPPPAIGDGRSRRSAAAIYSRHEIALPRWARNRIVLLHEIAHFFDQRNEPHGPEFVGILIGLMARHDNWDWRSLVRSARSWGLRVDVRLVGM